MTKAQRAILNAFIEIRSKKDLENMTVVELCKKADVNKSTFYVYYQDIYELSSRIEDELVDSLIDAISIPGEVEVNVADFTMLLCQSFEAKKNLINIVFSGNRINVLPWKMEKAIKNMIYNIYPEYKDDLARNILHSYIIYGCYYTYMQYQDKDKELAIAMAAKLSEKLTASSDEEARALSGEETCSL